MSDRSTGLHLCAEFFDECVAPAMAAEVPRLPYAAGLLGRGSEVLGYDDQMSTDHTWFARTTVFVPPDSLAEHGDSLPSRLTARIPERFEGVPTEITVTTVPGFFSVQLGLDVSVELDVADWLSLPEHPAVRHDGRSRVPGRPGPDPDPATARLLPARRLVS